MVFSLFKKNNNNNNKDDDGVVGSEDDRRKLSIQKARTRPVVSSDEKQESSTASSTAIRNSVIAGWTAGVTGTLAGYPLDSLKVWVQSGIRPPKSQSSGNQASSGILGAIRRYYAGVGGPVVTVGLVQSINFAVYDTTRRFWYSHFDQPNAVGDNPRAYLDHDSFTSIAVSGFAAGAVLSLVTSPMMMIKTVQQTRHDMNFRDGLRIFWRHPMAGFGVHFAVETLNRSVYFCTYEYLKRYLEQQQVEEGGEPQMSLSARMAASFAAGINCWAWLYPMDALRSRIYANLAVEAPTSGLQMARIMYAEAGWRSFFRGFLVTTIRAGPVAAAILPVYDYTLDALNRMS